MQRYQQTRHVLGSEAYLTLITDDSVRQEALFATLWDGITTFEGRFSRFREDSELSHFNQNAGKRIHVTRQFYDLLLRAKQLATATNGLYNPCILPALQRAGYKGSWPITDTYSEAIDFSGREVLKESVISLDGEAAYIPKNASLDFGGIGKGYLLDQLASVLSTQHVSNYWLSLGGDILCDGYNETGEVWRIAIQSATDPSGNVASVSNNGKHLAVATSGITKRKGEGWHHLIDPSTGKPAQTDVLTATVCMDTATEADVYAKCLVISGSDAMSSFATKQHIVNALLQLDESQNNRIVQLGDAWSN